jgi:Flp pilus assembly protein TadB
MATGPDLRIGDADREAAAASLREHYAVGRLTLDEFNQRLDAVFHATTQSQLRQITRDLPHPPAPSAPLPVTGVGRERAREDYQSGCGGHRARLGLLPVIIAAFLAWFVLFDLNLVFPWPGKLAIFLAVFAVVRRVVWRVIAASRSRNGGGYPRGRGR